MIELFLGINLYVWLFVQFCGSRLEFYALGQNRIERKGEKRRGGGGGSERYRSHQTMVLYLLTFFAFDKNTHLDD